MVRGAAISQAAYKSEKDLKKNADALFKKENFEAALPLFSQLLSLYPKNPDYSYKFGTCLLMADKRDIEKPISYLEAASKSEEVEKQVFYYLGLAYHYNYRFKDAINAYNQFLQQAPKSIHKKYDAARQIEMCYNGIALLSTVNDLYVLEKHHVGYKNFHRSYTVRDFGGRFLTLPPELKTKFDIKKEHNAIIFFSEKSEVLYFSSYGEKGETGKDIYRVIKDVDGTWEFPERLPGTINTEYDEDFPFIMADGLTMFFSSKGHNSMGGYDIFRTVLDTTTNTWSKPENLDFAINTPFDDILFITDEDMYNAYFASNRVSDIGMINVYKVYLEARPEKEQMALGDVFNLSKDDPAYKRSLELLKNRTKLEVNATESMFEKPILAVKTESENKTDEVKTDSINETQPLSNQDIIKLAYKQSDDLNTELNELKEKMNATKIVVEQRKQKALVRLNDAQKAKSDAARIKDAKQREDALIEASKVQSEADRMQKEAEVAENIYKDIQNKVIQKEKEVKDAETFADNIRKAIESDSPEKAMEILNQMSNEMETEDVSEYTDKSLEEIIANADKNIPEEQNEVANLISEVNRLNNEAEKLRKEAEQGKNKSIKEELIAQAENYEQEARQIQSEINQLTGAIVVNNENIADTKNDSLPQANNQTADISQNNTEQEKLNNKTNDILKKFEDNQSTLKNQQNYLLSEAQNKVKQSNTDYNKAQQLLNEAENTEDIKQKQDKLNEAQVLLEQSEKNTLEALAMNALANEINTQITKTTKIKEELINDINKIKELIAQNELDKVNKLIEEGNKKYVDAFTFTNTLDEKTKNDLIKKAEKNETEANAALNKANNLYNTINDNIKEIENLKKSNINNTNSKEVEKNRKRIEELESENSKLKVQADDAFRKGNEMKFEAGKLRMQVTINTQSIPTDINYTDNYSLQQANRELEVMQNNIINEKNRAKETEQDIKIAENKSPNETTVEVNNVTENDGINTQKEKLTEQGNELIKKYDELISIFEVKANKLYNYAEEKSTVSKIGITQADRILQNAQTIADKTIKNNEIEKANRLYQKSFEQAQEAMAAINLANEYDAQVQKLKKEEENLKNQMSQASQLTDANAVESSVNDIKKQNNDFDISAIEKTIENTIKQASQQIINEKQAEAQKLLDESQKQYTEAQKLKEEAQQLFAQAQNTNNNTQKQSLTNTARQKEQQANSIKQSADENFNKGEKLKFEVGVLKMKVEFTITVQDMSSSQSESENSKNNATSDINTIQDKINTHNFSETNEETKKYAETNVQPTTTTTIPTTNATNVNTQQNNIKPEPTNYNDVTDIKKLEDEINKNKQLANNEKAKVNAENDLNQKENILNNVNTYEQNATQAQIQIYNLKSKENTLQIDNNKQKIQQVKVDNQSDANANKAKILENEANIYIQKADNRRKEANNTNNASLKANLLEDAVRNEQLALQKQEEALDNYKKAAENIQQATAQNTQTNQQTTQSSNQQSNQNQQTNNQQTQNTTNTSPVTTNTQSTNIQNTANNTEDKNLISQIKGLFFTVQIGVFGASRTNEQLLNLLPIYYDRLNNGYYRYFSGVYNSRDAANAAKNQIVSKGIDDAFVVAFNNGNRISVNEAVALLQNGQARLQSDIAFTVPPSISEQPIVTAQTSSTSTGLYYAVQIGVYKNQRGSSQLFNISPIYYERMNNGYQRHLTGNFSKRADADMLKNEVVAKGIDDAFVVAYLNGKRITLAEARNYESGASTTAANNELTQNTTTTTATNTQNQTTTQTNQQENPNINTATNKWTDYNATDIVFKVQIGAFKEAMAPLIISQYKNLLNEDIEEVKTKTGLTLYLVGSFKDFLEASAFRNKVINTGITDAFVVSYHKNERIPLNIARELTK